MKKRSILTLITGTLLAMALPGAAVAQEEGEGNWPHPAQIVAGTCLAPGDIVASLGPTAEPLNDPQGAASFVHVDLVPSTGVFHELDDFLAVPHAIVVRNSDDDLDTLIACGEMGGHFVGADFVMGLAPVGDSGFAGVAYLTDQGDGNTRVRLAITNIDAAVAESDG